MSTPVSVQSWAERIRPYLAGAVESMIAAGRELAEAKAALPHGKFGDLLAELGISDRSAQRLMQVAGHQALANPPHAAHLPADVTTLAVLAQLEAEAVEKAVKAGEITPSLSRVEARMLVERHRPRDDVVERALSGSAEVSIDDRRAHVEDELERGEPDPTRGRAVARTRDRPANLRSQAARKSAATKRTNRERQLLEHRLAAIHSRLAELAGGTLPDDVAALVPSIDVNRPGFRRGSGYWVPTRVWSVCWAA